MKSPKFSQERIMATSGLILGGLFVLAWAIWFDGNAGADDPFRIALFFASGPILGAGVFMPFGRPLLGAVIGILTLIVLTFVFFSAVLHGLG